MKTGVFWASFFLFLGCAFSCQGKEEQEAQIGVIYNLTGEWSSLGVPSSKGFALAFEQLSSSEDKKLNSLKMILKDGRSDVSVVADQAHLLSSMPQTIALLGLTDDDMAMAAGKEAERARKVYISSGATSPVLPLEIPNYLFLVAFGDNAQAAAAAQFAYVNLKWKTVSILYEKDRAYTRFLAKYFIESFSGIGGTVISEENFPARSLDIDSQLKDIKESNPEFIYLAVGPEELVPLIKKIRDFGLKQPIFGGDTFETHLLTLEFSDIYYTTHVFLDPKSKNPLIVQFMEDYKKKYNEYPENAFAALAYDACNLFADALKRASSFQTREIISSLNRTVDFPGVTGKISYDKEQHVPIKPVTIVSIKNGKKMKEDEFLPKHVPPAKGYL